MAINSCKCTQIHNNASNISIGKLINTVLIQCLIIFYIKKKKKNFKMLLWKYIYIPTDYTVDKKQVQYIITNSIL